MLLYNHNKEFLGIDNEDLHLLGYQSFSELLSECHDFADLFVKKPGYIHNFKNFQWIDFVLHAEAEESKAIVHAKGRNFSCQIVIKTLFLSSAPNEEAYVIKLKHITPLSSSENAAVSESLAQNPITTPTAPFKAPDLDPVAAMVKSEVPVGFTPEDEASITMDSEFPSFDDVETTALLEPDTFDIPDENPVAFDPYAASPENDDVYPDFSKPLEVEDDLFMSDETPAAEVEDETYEALPDLDIALDDLAPDVENSAVPMLGDYISQDKEYLQQHQVSTKYIYDPQIAADELGLPVDLIEEFIGDFIAQSHEFHDELFESTAKEDYDNVKILSHKLKGVAANLRIEDAFEILSIINNSEDVAEIEANLRAYYRIVAHLEGKDVQEEEIVPETVVPVEETLEPMEDNLLVEERFIQEESPLLTPEAPTTMEEESLEDLYALDVKEPEALEPIALPEEDDLYDIGIKQDDDEPLLVMDTPEIAMSNDDAFEDLEPLSLNEELEPLLLDDVAELSTQTQLTEEPTLEVAMPTLQYDAQNAANELGLDSVLVEGIINDFATEALTKETLFNDAFISNDAASWQQTARELKGVTDNLRMTDISSSLQDIIKSNDSNEAAQAVKQFFNYVNQL